MKGYKTIIASALGLIFALMQSQGFIVAEADQAAIQTGLVSLTMLVLRFMTDTKVGES